MATCWLREVQDSNSGLNTGIPFAMKAFAWFLKEICGFTNFNEDVIGDNLLSYSTNGTNGEFNISGSDKQFRDSTAAAFVAGDVGRWIVIADSNRKNAGVYKILTYIDASNITVDFRSGAAEYPAQTTGISWWIISPVPASATGSITPIAGSAITAGDWIRVSYGQGINTDKVMEFSQDTHGYTPNTWRGGVVADNKLNRYNTLVGKTLDFTVAGVSKSCTFTGTNPLTMAQVISQLNTAAGQTVCHDGDDRGNDRGGTGERLVFRTKIGGVWGKPAAPPSADGNNITLTYSGSDAWTDLGLTGTSNLSNPSLSQNHGVFNAGDAAAVIGAWIQGVLNGYGTLAASGSNPVSIVNSTAGAYANIPIEDQGFVTSGMSGGSLGTTGGDNFTCRTPHANGWEVQVQIHGAASGNQYMEVNVSTNHDWSIGTGKVIGPVYYGAAESKEAWHYMISDDDGEFIAFLCHQNTNNYYEGALVCNVAPGDSGLSSDEKVALMGSVQYSAYTASHLLRTYNENYVGHGFVWWNNKGEQVDCWMSDLSYGAAANSLTQWSSRQKNARKTSALGYDAEDAIYGTMIFVDPDNNANQFTAYGKLLGLYSVRKNIGVRTAFAIRDQLDGYHFNEGIAFDWPEVTPQH